MAYSKSHSDFVVDQFYHDSINCRAFDKLKARFMRVTLSFVSINLSVCCRHVNENAFLRMFLTFEKLVMKLNLLYRLYALNEAMQRWLVKF